MSLLVKICGLRNATDVIAAADAGADAIGFVFAASPRQVTPAEACAAARAASRGIRRVAVMHHPTEAEWQQVLQAFAPDVLQTDAEDLAHLDVPAGVQRWPVFREGSTPDATLPDTFLYEGAQSGRGQTVDWEHAALIAKRGNMILAGGLNAGNVAHAVRTVRPFGVDVSSAVESAPGEKNPALIRDFVRAARAAERNA